MKRRDFVKEIGAIVGAICVEPSFAPEKTFASLQPAVRGSWEVVRGPRNAWTITRTSLSCNGSGHGRYWIVSPHPVSGNWLLEATFENDPGNGRQGLLFGVQGKGDSGYLLEWSSGLTLWEFENDSFTEVSHWSASRRHAQSPTTVVVMKTGATYAFRLNGTLINTICNPSWRRTDHGFIKGKEPDSGHYGFALTRTGTITDVRCRSIELAVKCAYNPVLPPKGPPGSWDAMQAFPGGVLRVGGLFYLAYTGIDASDPSQEGGGFGRLGLATSHDLVTWAQDPNNPVLGPGPAGAWDSNHLQFGPITRTADGGYAVTYQAWNPMTKRWHGIGVAFAKTPLGPYLKYKDNPVLRPSANPGEFDGEHIHLHTIIRKPDGSYAMLYTGFSSGYAAGRPGDRGGLATSRDLIHWVKYRGNPVFDLGPSGEWDDGHVRPKGLVWMRGWYYMFHEGAHFDGKVWFDEVGMARSKDLIHWQRFPHNPIIPLDTNSGRDTLVTEWPNAIVNRGKLHVIYWGGSPGNIGISLARIPTRVIDNWEKPVPSD